jgi:hypothetical protein
MENGAVLWKPMFLQVFKKFLAYFGTRKLINMFITAIHLSLSLAK